MRLLRHALVRATVAVSDMDRARAFYEGRLGLEAPPGADGAAVLLYDCGGGVLQVYRSAHANGGDATRVSWSTEEHDALVDELIGRGVAFERYDGLDADERGVHAFGAHRVCWCRDPDGNVLAIDNGLPG